MSQLKVMRMLEVNFAAIFALLFITSVAQAKEWRGIVPLHSTRADVERMFGLPNIDGEYYDFGDERAFITYAAGPCEEGLPGGWNVPKDTVIEIYITPKKNLKLSDLLIKGKDYRKVRAAHTPHIYYLDAEEGIKYTVFDDLVQNITYFASAKDESLSCGEYKYAAPVEKGSKLATIEQIAFDTYGNIAFEDAKARLDNFAIQLEAIKSEDLKAKGYIIVYAGRRSYAGEAQFRADCAKNYLVKVRNIDAESLIAVDGGFREDFTVELYLFPGDVYPPLLEPTISPKKVEIIEGKLRKCNQPGASKP
jgi:hypothetical protein